MPVVVVVEKGGGGHLHKRASLCCLTFLRYKLLYKRVTEILKYRRRSWIHIVDYVILSDGTFGSCGSATIVFDYIFIFLFCTIYFGSSHNSYLYVKFEMRLFVGLIELRIFGSGSPAPANDFSLFLWLLHVFVMNFLMFTQPKTYFWDCSNNFNLTFFAIIVYNVRHCWVGGWQDDWQWVEDKGGGRVGQVGRRGGLLGVCPEKNQWNLSQDQLFSSPFITRQYLVEEDIGRLGLVDKWNICGRKKRKYPCSFSGARIQSNLSQDQHILLSHFLVKHFGNHSEKKLESWNRRRPCALQSV